MPTAARSPKELKPDPQIGKGQFQPGPFSPAVDSREGESDKSLQANPIPPKILVGIWVIFLSLHIQFWGLGLDDDDTVHRRICPDTFSLIIRKSGLDFTEFCELKSI